MRHSLAHVLAAAVARIYGYDNVKFGVGPTIDNGFYYDMDFAGCRDKDGAAVKISEDDLPKIEKEMRKIIVEKQDFVRTDKTFAEAEKWAREHGQTYKLELINDLREHGTTVEKDLQNIAQNTDAAKDDAGGAETDAENNTVATADVKKTFAKNAKSTDTNVAKSTTVSFYTNGDFTDLCRGGHVANTREIPADAFKLTRIAGAYWRGDEKNPMMTRIYGVAFASRKELDEFLAKQAEAKLRDHRRLGKELDLFVFSDLVGAGLPIFTPRGTVLRDELAKLSNELRENLGFQKVWTPHITKTDLYKVSGHLAKFGEGFAVEGQISKDKFMMKPMNCPHHTRIYASRPRSWRDLPLRYLETTTDYRDEKTGELGGLSRVRALTQDDSHVFCRADQIETEVANLMRAASELYEIVGMKLRVRLSYRDDSDNYLGSRKLWESAQEQLKTAVIRENLDYFEQTGEAAFYGPKIDFMATDALGREHQLATVQLDFVQPERFGLEYSAENGEAARPVMIHCALLGSIERFLSVYIEHTAGKFPVWCAPEQLRIILVNDLPAVRDFANEILTLAKKFGVRAGVDDSNNSVGKKIRDAEVWKVPYSVVVGEKEAGSRELPLRIRKDLDAQPDNSRTYAAEKLIETIADEVKNRVNKSSL